MIHEMRLNNEPFCCIKAGTKTIELRLYDEKRSKIKAGDYIEFINRKTNERIKVEVINIHKYSSFTELYNNFNKISLGYNEDEKADPNDMQQYYPIEEQEKYGVVGIEIKLIKKGNL